MTGNTLTDIIDWKTIQAVVASGKGSQYFPVGHELGTTKTNVGTITFRVLAHNHHKAAIDETLHTMTLEQKFVFGTTEAYKGFNSAPLKQSILPKLDLRQERIILNY